MENEQAKLLWNFPIQIDQKFEHMKPDIIVAYKVNRMCYLVEVAWPANQNLIKKATEKPNRYTDLHTDVARL